MINKIQVCLDYESLKKSQKEKITEIASRIAGQRISDILENLDGK